MTFISISVLSLIYAADADADHMTMYSALEAELTGVDVQLTSEATVYEDCAAVTVSNQPESNLNITSHECRTAMSYMLCQTGKSLMFCDHFVTFNKPHSRNSRDDVCEDRRKKDCL